MVYLKSNTPNLFFTGIRITEHLTKQRLDLLRCAQRKVGKFNAWTDQGVVYVFVNGRNTAIKDYNHLDFICNKYRVQK